MCIRVFLCVLSCVGSGLATGPSPVQGVLQNVQKNRFISFTCQILNRNTPEGLIRIYYKLHTRVYPKVSGLAAWSKHCKWYSSLPLGTVISLFCKSV
jgi:hypothetical protein